ncbi:RTA1 like protein-domain-containing protein [Dactylonectria estremocensis]|uniref:RTA1 like protein-domain-containing protein n=1 Tax=Dactylonectria estremocensis TaxID=1079267 RepID=A0A9P9FD86_9HYPO|nr:RTA1 like protein-domain-containing protein [Dactylonectria estremocensis]
MSQDLNVIYFGPDANCTLELCDIQWSVYKYQPSLAANVTFIVLYAIAMGTHIFLGVRWRSWWYMIFMMLGCLSEIIGYIGRIILHYNPFSFPGFMIQIVFVTSGPVYYTAAIYVTLAKTIQYLAPEVSRIKPKLIWWIFIPADIICLTLQAAGGALSTVSQGSSQTGVDIAMAGLALQVVVLVVFCVLMGDYLFRYLRSKTTNGLNTRLRLFFGFLSAAVLMILGRCAFRCYELSEGYQNSSVITDEGLFIGLEGVLIVIAVFCLCIGHPGFVFNEKALLLKSRPTSHEEMALETK